MRLKYTLAVIVILCLANGLICNVYAADSSAVSNDAQNAEASEQIIDEEHQSIANLREQIALLESKNRLLEEKNRNFLNQMYRAINLAPMLTIAVIGLIFYFTHRRYEKDKFLLMCIIKSEIAKLRAEIEYRYPDLEMKSKVSLQGKNKSLEQSIRNIAESIISDAVRPVDGRIKSLMENNLILQMDISTLQAEQQMSKGQLTSAIRCWVDVAQKAWSIKWNWRVTIALDRINYLLNKGAKITLQSSKAELTAFLQSLPPQFEPLVKAIQAKI
ncbi:MAG: hypothetical protein WAV28_03575 [Sedimentisphaerales bacterium]